MRLWPRFRRHEPDAGLLPTDGCSLAVVQRHAELPGSRGEHELQQAVGSVKRARAFYNNQVLDHVNAHMREYLARQEMMFVSTADGAGNCDCTFRAGRPGFMKVFNPRTIAYPEYRGNGVMASMGNLLENPRIGLLFLDFFATTIGLHINGMAKIVENADLVPLDGWDSSGGPTPERWVVIDVEEAYIHCSKHVPQLMKMPKDIDWGTDDMVKKGGDFFKAKASPAPWKRPDSLPS